MQGENVFYLGALGAGYTTKLINSFMGMTTVAAMSQAFVEAGMGNGNVPEIMDYFLKLEK